MYEKKHRFADVHPLRWRRTRPFAAALLRTAADHRMGEFMSAQFMQSGMNDMMQAYNPAIMRLPFEKRPDNPMDVMTREMSIAMFASAFWTGNRNVVAMDPSVLELLEHTDADNVPMAAILWTHPFVHVALPAGNGIVLPGAPNELDGAYVDTRMEGHIQIVLTTRRTDVDTRRATWPLSTEPYFSFTEKTVEGETVGQFVARCVEERVAGLLSDEHEEARRKAVDEINADPDHGHAAGRHYESVAQRNNARRADEVEAAAPAAARALSLVVNLMCYLSTEPELKRDYSPPLPKALAQKANGTPRQRQVAKEEMVRLGILPIMVAGRGSVPEPAEEAGLPTGRTTAAHWRRGHYNTYWTGPGRTIPRIHWIKPRIVNEKRGTPTGVHVHPVVPA